MSARRAERSFQMETVPPSIRPLLESVVDWARHEAAVQALVVLGSVAAGTADHWSDLDIAIVTADRERLWSERRELARRWDPKVLAIVDVSRVRPFLAEIIYKGVRVVDVSFDEALDDALAGGGVVVVGEQPPSVAPAGDQSAEGGERAALQQASSDPGTWMWLWNLSKLVSRNDLYGAHIGIASFISFALLPAVGVPPGSDHAMTSLSAEVKRELEDCLPRTHDTEGLRAAIGAAARLYRDLTRPQGDTGAIADDVLRAIGESAAKNV